MTQVEITCGLLKKAMEVAGWASAKFLIDGFPRNADNEEGWCKMMAEITEVKFMLFFDCPKVGRLTKNSGCIGGKIGWKRQGG